MDINFLNYEQYLDQSLFYKKDEILNDNPSMHLFIRNSLLMKDRDTFYLYKNSNLNSKGISTNLLYDLIQQPGMNMYLLSMFDLDDSMAVNIQLFEDGKQVDVININKADLITSYTELLNQDNKFTIEDVMRIHLVKGFNSINTCLSFYADEIYKCIIDSEEYEFPAKVLLDLLFNEEMYKQFLTSDSFVYPKEIVAYMIVSFVEREEIFKKYVIDEKIKQRYDDLKNQKTMDFEAVNKLKKSDDVQEDGTTLLDRFNISDELRSKIFEHMNPEYDKVEQAIYIYVRLCDLLTYDEESYLSSSMFERKGIHYNIENISLIDSEENKVVSYEFILIYAKLLKEIGVNYSAHLNSLPGYSSDKSSLDARCSKYLFKVDLFKDIANSDMTNVKAGGAITGIKSTNTSPQTKQVFDEKLYNVYSDYKRTLARKEAFDKNKEVYAKRYYKNPNIPRRTRLFTILKLICREDLKGLDSASYVLQTFNNIFADDETVEMQICATTVNNHIRPVNIISVCDADGIVYLVVNPSDGESIQILGQRELNRLFAKNVYRIVNNKKVKGIGDEDDIGSSERKM